MGSQMAGGRYVEFLLTDRVAELERRIKELERHGFNDNPLGDLASALVTLPEVRGVWVPSSVNESGNVFDLSEQGRTLTNTGTVTRGVYNGVVPYAELNGSSQYFTRASEAGLTVTAGGLTVLTWMWADALTASMCACAKGDSTATNRNYDLYLRGDLANDPLEASVANGSTVLTASATSLVTASTFFMAGVRWTPGVSVDLLFNGTVAASNTTSIPETINSSTAAFQVGARNAANHWDGRWFMTVLCASALSNKAVTNIYSLAARVLGV